MSIEPQIIGRSERPLPQLSSSMRSTRTHCPYCALQCGMVIEDDGTTIRVRGDDQFPVNQGQLCIKGYNSTKMLDHPDRLLRPLRRLRDGRIEPIGYEAALDEIAHRLCRIRDESGPASLAAFGSGSLTNEKAYLLGKFVRVALRSPNVDYNGRYCMSSAAAAQNRAFGIDRGMPFPVADIPLAKTVVLWGSNLAETLPPIMQYFEQLRDNGGRLIVVDPRRTETCQFATLHVQPTPGSDLALLNGLLQIAITLDLIDHDYITARTTGFESAKAAAMALPIESVEKISGVSVSTMREVVAALADGPTMLLSGRGPEQQAKGVNTVNAMTNLMLALGKVGKPASGYGTLTGQGNGQGGREHGQKCDQLPGYRQIDNPSHRAAVASAWGIAPDALPGKGKSAVELIDSISSEGVRALIVFGSNLVVASPDSTRVAQKLRSLDLLVVVDPFMNETAVLAHFVLPTLHWAEEEGTMTNLEGRVIRRRMALARPVGVWSDIEILCGLAERLGERSRFAFASAKEVFDELTRVTAGGTADYSGITYDAIDAQDGIAWPATVASRSGTPRLFADRFNFEDGRARFIPVTDLPGDELIDEEFPILFTTGRYREQYNSGAQTRRIDTLISARPGPLLQMHPLLASRLRIGQDSRVRVTSRQGSVEFTTQITSNIRSDTVFAPFHYGGAQAANTLIRAALDPISRMPEFKRCAVRIEAISPESSS